MRRTLILAILGASILAGCSRQGTQRSAEPAPSKSGVLEKSAAIQLLDGGSIDERTYTAGDSASGGHGAAISGIKCEPLEGSVFHIHAHLSVIVDGKQLQVPRRIGILRRAQPPCLYALHTHDATGIIHVEAPTVRNFTLGQFFGIWGIPLTGSKIATNHGRVIVYIDGTRYRGNPKDLAVRAQLITLEIGKRVAPPSYLFPQHE